MTDARQQLVQLLRASCSCPYCKGWGRVYKVEVQPKWTYEGFPTQTLGLLFSGDSAICPICDGTGDHKLEP